MKKNTYSSLPETEIVEVVLRKKMSYKHYKSIISETKRKGWSIQAYQVGVFSDGYGKKV